MATDTFNEGYTATTRDILAFGPLEKQRLLRELAWEMQDDSRSLNFIVQEEQLERVVCRHVEMVHGLTSPPIVVARALIAQLRERHYILAWLGGSSFTFVHRTFLE